jgi:type I restriction-modification system DNA methylase subunit
MTSETGFTENVLKAFKSIVKEIEKGSSEHDVRYRFVKYFVEEVLGYEPKYIKWEKKRADLTIIDENDFAVIKIETKRPTESIDKVQHEEQAFKYEEETTRFIGLTNFLQFKLWEVKKTGSELRLNLDFAKILEQSKPIENLSSEEKSQILFLNNLTKDTLFDPSKYEKFDETYARIDITKDVGFRKLLDRLNFIANNLLLGYTLRAFGEYKEGYSKYQAELTKAERESKNNKGNHELNHGIAKYRQKLEEKYKKYITFSGYELWKQYSGKEDVPDDEIKEIFCKETIYVLLNKLIFIRICEDKSFLEKNISNGGIEELRVFLKKRFSSDVINKEILEMAFKSASGLYSHFYEVGILDWFRTGDGELNELLNRVLWILNQFDFTHVDRDILGNLYEKYLPSGERKRLGEFYTPTEVIDYILTSVGYTYSHDIETKDLLDPACGSGGFLVRASRRLMSRYLMKFRKTDKRELRDAKKWKDIVSRLSPDEAKIILESLQEHTYGLDINPFACHIAEMNLLFQIIDLYQKVREKHPDYKLKRFKIYRTDSLEKPTQKQIIDYTHSAFLEEQDEIDSIKEKKFDFVVGNPPWGGILKREKGSMLAERLKQDYVSAVGKYDIYVLFIERGISWLKENGRFGFIVQNRFLRVDYGKKLREFLLENVKIDKIVDFGDTKVFADATNYPAIIIFERKSVKDNELVYIEIKPQANELSSQEVIDYVKSYSPKSRDYMSIIKINQEKLKTLNAWLPSQIIINSIIKRLKNVNDLKELVEEIMEGVTFGGKGADNIFVIDNKTIKSFKIESKLYKKVLKGRDIRKWNLEWDHRYLFYPYDENGNELNIKEFSNSCEYVKQFYDSLSRRILDGKKITEWGKQWFSFWRVRNPEVFTKQKILSPRIATNNSFALDLKGEFYLTDSAVAIVPKNIDIKYLLGVLNSNLLFFIVKNTSPFVQGRYYSYTRTYLDNLPIKLPSTPEEKKIANQIIKRVDEILELHKSGIVDINVVVEDEETEKLHQLPKVSFNINDNAKFEKIKSEGNKIYITSQDFIEIKDKKIRDFVEAYLNSNNEKLAKSKDVKNMILNIPVPKSDEVLKELIKKGGADQSQIKEKIKKLEDEIDELVYQIYGITQSEIKIVEANL